MFDRLSRRVTRRPWLAILAWLLLAATGIGLAIVGVGGEGLFQRLTTSNPTVPGSESEQGSEILVETAAGGETLSLVVQGADPHDEAVAAALEPARRDLLRLDGVAGVIDPFMVPDGPGSPAAEPLLARDGDGFLVVVDLEPDLSVEAERAALDAVEARLRAVPADLSDAAPGAEGLVGGNSLIVDEIVGQVEEDLVTGEAIALPVALLVMVVVFGGFLAAGMPMLGALASIGVGMGALLGYSYLIDLDSSVVNVVTLLGLGLSIDYGLLVVSRYREELHRVLAEDDGVAVRRRRGDGAVVTAVHRTLATAGRTVAFSALTIAIAISGLLVFSPELLRSFGLAGIAVVLLAMATALTLVPAALTLAGRRLVRPGLVQRIPGLAWLVRHTGDVVRAEGVFSRLAGRMQRRPWLVLGGVVAVLAVLASPLFHLELRTSGIELLPVSNPQRQYVQALSEDYPAASAPAVTVVAQATLEETAEWAEGLADVVGVAQVDPPSPVEQYVVVGVRPAATDPAGEAVRNVVQDIRALDAPFPVWVTGQAAHQIDFVAALAAGAPWAIGIVVLATFVLLFLMTGSLLIPVKALAINAVSLGASLGVLVFVFQDGNLSGLLGFQSSGGIETYVLALVVAFGFGLSMDYEVFLLARIKELYDAGHDNDAAVRLGLQRSGRIITSAAAIMIVVFLGFVFGELLVIKQVGFALAVAVLIDATLVRLLLVPATMTLLRDWNWWAPGPLRRLHSRIAVRH